MPKSVDVTFIRGRPFGGVAILAKKSVVSNVSVIGVDNKNRCLTVMITFLGNYKNANEMLIIMPYIYKFSAAAEMNDSLATIDMGRKLWGCAPIFLGGGGEELGPI